MPAKSHMFPEKSSLISHPATASVPVDSHCGCCVRISAACPIRSSNCSSESNRPSTTAHLHPHAPRLPWGREIPGKPSALPRQAGVARSCNLRCPYRQEQFTESPGRDLFGSVPPPVPIECALDMESLTASRRWHASDLPLAVSPRLLTQVPQPIIIGFTPGDPPVAGWDTYPRVRRGVVCFLRRASPALTTVL
jgi:hypothetical protein